MRIIAIVFLLFLSVGCGHWSVIHSGKEIESPEEIKTVFKPNAAIGKETITKGTDKIIEKSGFETSSENLSDLNLISISKGNIKVTIAHASFGFLKDNYKIENFLNHPLAGKDYTPMHIWGPNQAPAWIAYYRVDNDEIYQVFDVIPFYNCSESVYRDEANKKLMADFNQAFIEGSIKPFVGDTRTTQEIKTQMERLIGQPYCGSYYPSNIVFYVRVENLGNEKIRLWPIEESVLIDNNNIQYRALNSESLNNLLQNWREGLKSFPSGKENPILGIAFGKKRKSIELLNESSNQITTEYEAGLKVLTVYDGLPAKKAGVKKGDMLLSIDDQIINSQKDFAVAFSNKLPGDIIKLKIKRKNELINFDVKLISADEWPKPKNIKLLAGGNVYPNVIYDGFLIFDTAAMFNNIKSGSKIKLIIPLIGTNFDASDKPIRSFDFEFDFEML